jgi:flavin reductase (DIM6/NTAB) family NADH-FMN oxidoreductase RutF
MDIEAKKQTLRMLPYGLYVLTARSDEGTNAATVSWLSQASIEPPRIVVALGNETGIWHQVRRAGTFSVNVLGSGQKHLASAFFRRVEPEGNVLGGSTFHEGVTGAPIWTRSRPIWNVGSSKCLTPVTTPSSWPTLLRQACRAICRR